MASTLSRWGPTGRIRLVLGALFPVSVATGAWRVWQSSRLGPAIGVVMRENYRSVRAMQALKEALERLDSGAIYAVDGQDAEGRRLFAQNDPAARAALATEIGNLTLPGERQRAEALEGLYDAMLSRLEEGGSRVGGHRVGREE